MTRQSLEYIKEIEKVVKKKIIILNLLTQCMPKDSATALALILDAKISGSRRAGTGPAPSENDST